MSNARIKKTGEIRAFYPTTQSGFKGYVDTDGRFYYPEQLDFRNEGRIVGPNGETLNIQEVREYMIPHSIISSRNYVGTNQSYK